jgi:hypothetical protein
MRIIVIFLAAAPLVSGFLFGTPVAIKQGLVQVTDAVKTTPLTIKLDVGVNDKNRMSINNMIIELTGKKADYEHPLMPGADGPHPQLSSGVRALNLLKEGSFINMMGENKVSTLHGCWEMIWRENAAAGSLICGFDVPEEYSRNDATLPKGRLYVNFPVWTKIGLKEAQEEKEYIMKRVKELRNEKDEHFHKYRQDPNPLMKALHYRNAAAAAEKLFLYNPESVKMVPDSQDVIALQDDLLLTTFGTVFSRDGSFKHGGHKLLGSAFLSRPATDMTGFKP